MATSSTAVAEPLQGVRVLDLADESGLLCGRVLADLGADVLALEPPAGSAARHAPPLHDGTSLVWLAGSLNKRGITCDWTCPSGRALFEQLLEHTDVVIETPGPGRRLDFSVLHARYPRLVVATLTPYGADALEAGSDLEVTAASGCLWLAGEPGRPPVRTSLPQTPSWTGMYAAAGVVMALLARDVTGAGQQVDVSAQSSMLTATSQAPIFWDLLGQEQRREGAFLVGRSVTGARFRNIWPCQDGYVTFALYGGQAGRTAARNLVGWMDEVLGEAVPAVLHEVDWDTFDVATASQAEVERIEAAIGPFFAGLNKATFFREVSARSILGYPVATVEDVAADEQLLDRQFWQSVSAPWGETIRVPGSFALFDGQRPPLRRPAPRLGEHNVEVYCGELGLRPAELDALRAAGIV